MVPSTALAVSPDDERLTCGGFSLGKTIRFWSLQFIADCFGGLSLSPRRNDSDADFMGSTRNGSVPAAGHDRGLHRGAPHDFEWRGGLWPPLSQKLWHGGIACSRHNPVVAGEGSGH
jgi:hypothetical protein